MSGGSMDYLYSKVQDANFSEDTVLRRAFRAHLNKVAEALHDIEWVDSCDYGKGDEEKAIRAVLGATATLEQALMDAKKVKAELDSEIQRAEAKNP